MNKRHAVSLVILLLVLVIQAYADNNEESDNIKQLRELGRRCLYFAQDNNGRLPPNLETLHYKAYVNRLKLFTNPAMEKSVMERTKIDAKSDYVLSYRAHLIPAKESLTSSRKGPISTLEHIKWSRTTEVTGVKTEMDIRAGQPSETRITIEAPIVPDSGDAIPVIQDRSAANNGGRGKEVYVFYSDGSIRLKSGAVVSRGIPTIERPKLERPEAQQATMESTIKKRPAMERPKPEISVTERTTPEIPVAERPKPERPKSETPIPDKQSFEDYKKEQLEAYKKWLEEQTGSQ